MRLGIYNDGTGAMADSSTYRIYVDAQLAFTRRFKLAAGDSLILRVPGNGRTVRMEADQATGHPAKQSSSISLEACGTGTGGRVSKGFVAQLPPDDEGPDVDIECLPIIDSYDSNDKRVQPIGTTADHYTGTGKPLRYTLRFQNTGTDYAYTVTVVDTLSEHLDVSTLEAGAVSHPYQFTITGKGRPVLTWTFNGINLPDSSRDKAGSNGLIQFAIRPKAELPLKTRIENFADIFFDYNPPVRTNMVLNTIYDVPLVVEQGVRLDPGIVIAMPVITDFSPRAGMAGTVVSIAGTNFDSVAANNKVTFNGVAATVTQATPTVLTVVVPPGSVEGKIRVTTAYGVALSHTDFTLLPTALEKPVPDNLFTLHPNPVTEYCILEFAKPTNRVVSIQAYNELGQQVLYQSIGHRTMQREKVYFGNLPKGIYLLVIKTDQEIFTRKVVFL